MSKDDLHFYNIIIELLLLKILDVKKVTELTHSLFNSKTFYKPKGRFP